MLYLRKWCEIEPRWQLITNSKLYISFLLQQKSLTLNDLERKFSRLSSVLCVCDQTAEARITRFSLYSSTIPQPFAYYVWRRNSKGIPSNFKHNFGLTCRRASVTQVYCDKTTANEITQFSLRRSKEFYLLAWSVLETKFDGVFSIGGLDLCWSGLELCQSVVIAGYTHMTSHYFRSARPSRNDRNSYVQ